MTEAELQTAPEQAALPFAKVYGEPMLEVPADLYIPPGALEIFLEHFEGPLDLLLYLIRRHNLDVLDIPMAKLTKQYLAYVDIMRRQQLELAAEYLLMAALLMEIKSRMLLPRPPAKEGDQEAADPRAELVRRLLEYERMKAAAQKLNALPQIGRDFQNVQAWVETEGFERLPMVEPDDLRQAWMTILARAKMHTHHRVTRDQLSVRDRMTQVLRRLQAEQFVEFDQLFDVTRGVPELVVTFIAILELAREKLIDVAQQAAFAPIYVRLASANEAEAA